MGILRRLTAPQDDSFFVVFYKQEERGQATGSFVPSFLQRYCLTQTRILCNNEYRKQKGCDTDGAGRNSALQRYPFAFLRQSKQKAANHCSAIAPVHLRFYIFKKKLKRGQQSRPLVPDNCDNFTIHAPAGSYAEQYAKENNIPFVAE